MRLWVWGAGEGARRTCPSDMELWAQQELHSRCFSHMRGGAGGGGGGLGSEREGWARAELTSEPLNMLCFVHRQVPGRTSLLQRSPRREQGKPRASPKDSTEAMAPLRVSISWPCVSLPHTGLGFLPLQGGNGSLFRPGFSLKGHGRQVAGICPADLSALPLHAPHGSLGD